jgi:hypothetical protein
MVYIKETAKTTDVGVTKIPMHFVKFHLLYLKVQACKIIGPVLFKETIFICYVKLILTPLFSKLTEKKSRSTQILSEK